MSVSGAYATAAAAVVLVECDTSNIVDVRTLMLRYSYTIGKSGDNWDDGEHNDDLTFTGLKGTTTGHFPGLGYMCFLTGTDTVNVEPACGAPGTETEINTDSRVSDGSVQCTARVAAPSPAAGTTTLTLKIKNTRLEHMRVRHCVFAGDSSSPAVHLEFKGKSAMVVIFFGVLAFGTTLAVALAVLAFLDRRREGTAGTQPGTFMHQVYEFTGARWFIVLIVILATGTIVLSHYEWKAHTEFYVTLSLGIFAVLLPIGLLVYERRKQIKFLNQGGSERVVQGPMKSDGTFMREILPRRMRTVTVRT